MTGMKALKRTPERGPRHAPAVHAASGRYLGGPRMAPARNKRDTRKNLKRGGL